MQPISEAVYQKHLTSSPLPLIPFAKWVERLERYTTNANEENIRQVVSCIHEFVVMTSVTDPLPIY